MIANVTVARASLKASRTVLEMMLRKCFSRMTSLLNEEEEVKERSELLRIAVSPLSKRQDAVKTNKGRRKKAIKRKIEQKGVGCL